MMHGRNIKMLNVNFELSHVQFTRVWVRSQFKHSALLPGSRDLHTHGLFPKTREVFMVCHK
jgi:hypothetical protein